MKCAAWKTKSCYGGKDCPGMRDETTSGYSEEERRSMAVSAQLESRYYMKLTRLEEIIHYAKDMGYRHLGMAFCIGLEREASVINEILEKEFEVSSVCCKVCGIDKKDLGLERLHSYEGVEATCNPLGQAMVLNKEGTDLNIILGLCIGHDVIFTKNSKAPVTTLAVKDRVLAHNPLGAIYSRYYLGTRFGMILP